MSESRVYENVPLTQISVSPFQVRKTFDKKKIDELAESIKANGQISAAVVRPVGPSAFEIVAGERRFRATKQIAKGNGGVENYTLYCEIKELSDDEAFDLMTIENLQREDLTPMEEAEGFKVYLDKKGPDALADLSERTGIKPQYIRRHMAVLELPKKYLKMWRDDELSFGHLELLLRLPEEKDREEIMEEFGYDWTTVKELKEQIDSGAVPLKDAWFDLADDCVSCSKNTDVQKSLFDLGMDKKAHCTAPDCFREKQIKWMKENWLTAKIKLGVKTNGFIFLSDDAYHRCETIGGKQPPAGCKTCEDFVSVLNYNFGVSIPRVCTNKQCLRKKLEKKEEEKKQQTESDGADVDTDDDNCSGPEARVAWHGEFFREAFFQEAMPARWSGSINGVDRYRMMMFAVIQYNYSLREWFESEFLHEDDPRKSASLFQIFANMEQDELDTVLQAVSIYIIMENMAPNNRCKVADFINIDLAKEWRITEEYLKAKTVKEIHAIAEEFGIFEQESAKTFLYEKLLKKPGKFTSCKKGELIQIFMESGVDLAGVVPSEILNI